MILFIVKDSAKAVFTRLLDGIEPETIDRMTKSAYQVEGVHKVSDVKARWFGHEILAELTITTDSNLSVKEGHDVVKNVIHRLQHDVEHLSKVQVHVDPVEEQGYSYHEHAHLHAGHDHDRAIDHAHSSTKYPYEWAGVYKLSSGDYEFTLNAGPDPAMLVSFLSLPASDAFDHAKLDAAEIFGTEIHTLSSGGVIKPCRDLIQLELAGDVTFVVRIDKEGFYAMFTEHHPTEFDATLRRDGTIIPVLFQQDFPSEHAHHDHDKHHHSHKHSHHSHKHHVLK